MLTILKLSHNLREDTSFTSHPHLSWPFLVTGPGILLQAMMAPHGRMLFQALIGFLELN